MTASCSRFLVSLALLPGVLPLMTSSLSSSQRQNPGNYGVPETASVPVAERGGNSKGISPRKADREFAVPNLETIPAGMSQAAIRNETHLTHYTAAREYELFGRNRNHARSMLIAHITFVPPDSMIYSVRRVKGGAIGEMIVRRVLGREASIAKDGGSSGITKDNYNFQFVREGVANRHRCYVLQMLPRRKDKNLLRGTIWVDATTYLVHRVEGEPEKNPSWWVRDVHIVLIYGDIGGMWLPASSKYTARVRLLGPSMMVAHDLRYRDPRFAGSRNRLVDRPPVSPRISASFSSKK
jgi:hypothetical protein